MDDEFIGEHGIRLDLVAKTSTNELLNIVLRKQLVSSEEGTNMQKKTIITCIKDHYIIVQSYTHHNKTQLDTFSSIKKAIEDSKKETAKNLLDMNLPVDRIAKATGLSIDEVNVQL